MAKDDVRIGQNTDTRRGYLRAVGDFCTAADGQVVKPKTMLSMASEVYLNGGKDPKSYGILGFVYFEVHNKQSVDHKISANDCKTYLSRLSEKRSGTSCYGENNGDTKGGTWQVGNEAISYHALANSLPPNQDALNKLFTGPALEALSVNKGSGSPLDPWPLDLQTSILPTSCHSHNDYEKAIPLWSALAAGCSAIETDVWLQNGEAILGHNGPERGRLLLKQYVEPLRKILDHNNRGATTRVGLYKAKPGHSVTLMVDFKSSGDDTLAAVVKALEPLRQGGYLSSVVDGKFVERQITVVASGSSNFDRFVSGSGIPNRDVFYDAKLDAWDARYSTTNSQYASANLKSQGGWDKAEAKVREQVNKAHAVGLKVRYYDLPSTDYWERLANIGVDRLNADDMSETARLPRL